MTDIVEQLRDRTFLIDYRDRCEIADKIERLQAERDALTDEVELKSAALTGTSKSTGAEIERLRQLDIDSQVLIKKLEARIDLLEAELERTQDKLRMVRIHEGRNG